MSAGQATTTELNLIFHIDGKFAKVALFSNYCPPDLMVDLYQPIREKFFFHQLQVINKSVNDGCCIFFV